MPHAAGAASSKHHETTPLLQPTSPRSRSRRHHRTSAKHRNTVLILVSVFAAAIVLSLVLKHITNEFSDAPPSAPLPPGTDKRGRLNPAVLAKGSRGAVAAENVVCSTIGLDALKSGGSAVDAAVAATLCTGVLNMFSSGIGGGGFMLVRDPAPCYRHAQGHDADRQQRGARRSSSSCADYTAIDFRETGPAAANETMYKGRTDQSRYGGLSVGVPGELRGLEEAHRRWGKLPWKQLVMPSVRLAEKTRVSKELARRLVLFGQFMYDDPAWSEIFVDPATGLLKREGDTVRRTAYARTLRAVAEHGADAFYSGVVADSIVATVQAKGGILTHADLLGYKPLVEAAVEGEWVDGRRVFTTPAPTSGPILLSILNVLSLFPSYLAEGPTGLNVHRFLEALKFGFAQRTELADPAFVSASHRERMREITTMDEARRVFANLTDDTTHPLDYYGPKFDIVKDHGTMHLSVVDAEGGAVALTSTVNLVFGSRVLDRATGVILNDEMDDTSTPEVPNAFGLAPSPYNYPGAGKRPLSSTCPTMLEQADGTLDLVVGGSGGSRIFGSVLQTILQREWGSDLSEAIERPRVHHQLLPAVVSVESGYDAKILNALMGRGHEVAVFDVNLGAAEVQAVEVKGKGRQRQVWAASDSRKGGIAVAY
ncbi:hypothetical protein ACQY0O_005385 [Thecaphora frezii]